MERTDYIQTKADFINFLNSFNNEYKVNGASWENNTLDSFLEALIAYVEDIDGYYENMKLPELKGMATWRTFADMLIGATMYE